MTLNDKERKHYIESLSRFCLIKKVNIVVCPYHESVCKEVEQLHRRVKQQWSGKSEAEPR